MTEGVIDNIAEEVLGTTSKSGFGHLHWLFEFTRALGAPDEVISEATPNVDAMASASFLYCLAQQQPWYELTFGGILAIENQIPPAYIKVVKGFKAHYGDILQPDDYAFHTIHITVDEDHGGHVGEFAERYLDTNEKRRAARAAYFAGAELTRRCWDSLSDCSW
jgi:pyrroloquinoline quinone (PQQ) biosynthesis protein C